MWWDIVPSNRIRSIQFIITIHVSDPAWLGPSPEVVCGSTSRGWYVPLWRRRHFIGVRSTYSHPARSPYFSNCTYECAIDLNDFSVSRTQSPQLLTASSSMQPTAAAVETNYFSSKPPSPPLSFVVLVERNARERVSGKETFIWHKCIFGIYLFGIRGSSRSLIIVAAWSVEWTF